MPVLTTLSSKQTHVIDSDVHIYVSACSVFVCNCCSHRESQRRHNLRACAVHVGLLVCHKRRCCSARHAGKTARVDIATGGGQIALRVEVVVRGQRVGDPHGDDLPLVCSFFLCVCVCVLWGVRLFVYLYEKRYRCTRTENLVKKSMYTHTHTHTHIFTKCTNLAR